MKDDPLDAESSALHSVKLLVALVELFSSCSNGFHTKLTGTACPCVPIILFFLVLLLAIGNGNGVAIFKNLLYLHFHLTL